ncbi:MAG: glycosyltransferase family 39 protein [Phycisphaeraceae bacterium]
MNEATTKSEKRTPHLLAILTLLVTAIAGYLHSGGLNDVIAWDEANYTLAAGEGFIANATQMGDLSEKRHEHAPLTAYAIALSTSLFGYEEWAIRLPAVVICALSAGLLVLIGFDLARGHSDRTRLLVGLVAGLSLATAPTSIEMAGVIQPHSFVIFFMLLNLWLLCRYLRDLKRRDALIFGASLAGQFVTMEYGPIVLGFAMIAVALARPVLLFGHQSAIRNPRSAIRAIIRLPRTIHRDILHAALLCFLLILILWPAGIIMLGAARNFTYYLLYAAHGHPTLFRGEMHAQVPKYAYAYWYGQSYPLLLVTMIVAITLIFWKAWRTRDAVAVTLAVFTGGLMLAVHASHIMQLSKSIFMIPPLVLGGPLAAAWLLDGKAKNDGRARLLAGMAFALALALAAILGGQTSTMSRDEDKNIRLVEMCNTIARDAKPGDDVLAQAWPMVEYHLRLKHGRDDLRIHRYDPRNYEINRLGPRLAAGEFEWAVTIGPSSAAHPDCRALATLREQWRVVEDHSIESREYRLYHTPATGQSIAKETRK